MQLQRNEGGRDTRGIRGAHHATGGFADAEVGSEKADDVEAEPGVLTRECGGKGREAKGEIENHLPVGGGQRGDAQLAIFDLMTKALQGAEASYAAEPGQGIGPADALQPASKEGFAVGRITWQGELHFEWTGTGRMDFASFYPIEQADESGSAGLGSASVRMGAVLTAENQGRDGLAGRQPECGLFPDPG